MRYTILRMIAAGSLSAFNTAAPASIGVARPAHGATVQPARAAPTPAPQQAQPTPDKPPALPSGRIPPRGSVLNLSV